MGFQAKDATGATKTFAATGAGTSEDPYVPEREANLRVGSTDVGPANPAPVQERAPAYQASWRAAVDNTLNGKTLATLKGSALEAGTLMLSVRPELATDDVRYNPTGNASATSAKLPVGGLLFRSSQASTLKLFSTAGANVSVDEVA